MSAAALARTQYQYTLQDAESRRAQRVGAEAAGEAAEAAGAAGRRHRPADQRATVSMTIDRDQAARFGIQPQLIDDTLYDAFGQRQVTQYFTQLNSYHVILEVTPRLQARSRRAGQDLHEVAAHRAAGAAVGLRQVSTPTKTRYLSINHQGQFPAVTLSFNLAPGVALGQAVEAIQAPRRRSASPRRSPAPSRARRRRSSPRWRREP